LSAPDPALSEAEIDQLAERLGGIQNPDRLTLEGVDGLFCALIASPEAVPPSEYLPVILGGEDGQNEAFMDPEDANVTMSLLMRYWNSIIADLERESIHPPFVFEVGTGQILGREWARGFMAGTRLAPEGWEDIFADEQEGDLLVIPLVAGEVDPEWPKEPVTTQLQDDVLMSMGVGFARSYRYFAEARLGAAEEAFEDEELDEFDDEEFYPETYVRPEPKIGRNEPCPCGSGKKYKKCCGASE
jgi:uncharacterized protein